MLCICLSINNSYFRSIIRKNIPASEHSYPNHCFWWKLLKNKKPDSLIITNLMDLHSLFAVASFLLSLALVIILAIMLALIVNSALILWKILSNKFTVDWRNGKLFYTPVFTNPSSDISHNNVVVNTKQVTTILVPTSCKLDFDFESAETTEKDSVKCIKSALYRIFSELNPNLTKNKAKKRKRQNLCKQVDKIVSSNSDSVTRIATSYRDYITTQDNCEDVINSITASMKESCEEASHKEFQNIVRRAIQDGLICGKEVYEDQFILSCITNEYVFLMRFRIKVVRTLKGWILSYPEITAKYASFVLKAKLQSIVKSIKNDGSGDDLSESSIEHNAEIND